jgi:ABC-type amino acid transport system permease subunit
MSKSQKDHLEEMETLLAGLREVAAHPVRPVPVLSLLANALDDACEARDAREVFRTATKEARQELLQALARGHDAAVRARIYLKAYHGPYNAELTRFGIQPIRRGASKGARTTATRGKGNRKVSRTPRRKA